MYATRFFFERRDNIGFYRPKKVDMIVSQDGFLTDSSAVKPLMITREEYMKCSYNHKMND